MNYLSTSNSLLDKVVLHVTLEVEVGKLLTILDVKKTSKLGIGMNKTTIGLILQVMRSDVSIDFFTDTSASKLSSNGLSEELGKLITNASRLSESGWLS